MSSANDSDLYQCLIKMYALLFLISQLDVDILFVFKSKCTTFHKSILKCKVGKVVLHITNNSTHTHAHNRFTALFDFLQD